MHSGRVTALSRDAEHRFSKPAVGEVRLVAGRGVDGDCHSGFTVQHRSRVARDPAQPNLRQVHLLPAELFEELSAAGFTVRPGDLGENITTTGLNLLAMSTGTRFRFPAGAEIELTGLRNPCRQIERFCPGLLASVLDRHPNGALIRKAGVMAIVRTGGRVCVGDRIEVSALAGEHRPLQPV